MGRGNWDGTECLDGEPAWGTRVGYRDWDGITGNYYRFSTADGCSNGELGWGIGMGSPGAVTGLAARAAMGTGMGN